MTANNIKTTQAKLMKLARAKRETFLHSGTTTPTVTKNTTPKRTAPIDVPHEGKKRTNTLDNVSPTTTLYEIMAKIIMKIYCHHRHSFTLCTTIYSLAIIEKVSKSWHEWSLIANVFNGMNRGLLYKIMGRWRPRMEAKAVYRAVVGIRPAQNI
uniref:Uncharacterized protein n=1 Tax=Glossina austeni TaxID=7395 RepID=A0A1A9VTB2_GLOAU